MCVTSTVIDGWRGPGWPPYEPMPTPYIQPQPHTQPLPVGPNAVPWITIQQDPTLAAQMLELLKKLEAIDKRLGQLEQCKASSRYKKNLKDRLRRIAKRTAVGKEPPR